MKLEKEPQRTKARVIGYNYPTTQAKCYEIHQSTFKLSPPNTQNQKQKGKRFCKIETTNAETNHRVYKQQKQPQVDRKYENQTKRGKNTIELGSAL